MSLEDESGNFKKFITCNPVIFALTPSKRLAAKVAGAAAALSLEEGALPECVCKGLWVFSMGNVDRGSAWWMIESDDSAAGWPSEAVQP